MKLVYISDEAYVDPFEVASVNDGGFNGRRGVEIRFKTNDQVLIVHGRKAEDIVDRINEARVPKDSGA